MLFKSAKGEECKNEFKKVTETYNCDLDKDLLETQLLLFRAKWKKEFKGDKIVLHNKNVVQKSYCKSTRYSCVIHYYLHEIPLYER